MFVFHNIFCDISRFLEDSSRPTFAVHRVVNALISERARDLERITSNNRTLHEKRMAKHTSVNITEDEAVYTKTVQSERRK